MLDYFEGRLKRGELKPTSLARQRGIVRDFAVSFGGRPKSQFGPKAVDRYMESIGHLSPGTRRGRVGIVRAFAKYLHVAHGYPDVTDAFPRVRVPRTVPRAIPRQDVARLFAGLPDRRARAIVALMAYQGLRAGEVANLRVEDYDGEQIWVTGKGGHQRVLPVADACRRCLEEWLREERGTTSGPFFPGGTPGMGLRQGRITHLVSEWMWNASVKHRSRDGRSAHALRHTAATRAARNGVSVWGVQELLGHASPATAAIYTRGAGTPELRQAVEEDYLVP
jgi:integrase